MTRMHAAVARARAEPSARETLDRSMSEDELLTAITDWATIRGWLWHHVRRSDKAQQMGHAGFPDLVLARRGVVLYAELKTVKGGMDADQFAWSLAMGEQHRLWRPADEDDAIRELT